MLLAVEGGGFFSASASGYSKGLALLLLGQKNEEKPMRVAPWNDYQLVEQEPDPDLQLATVKNRLSRGCASFVCFGRASAGLDSPSHLKVGPAQQQDVLPDPLVSENSKEQLTDVHDGNGTAIKVSLKSNLKKPSNSSSVNVESNSAQATARDVKISAPEAARDGNECDTLEGKDSDIPDHTERRKVQWTDACGSELVEIREFEPSEVGGSDSEFDHGNEKTCSCTIM